MFPSRDVCALVLSVGWLYSGCAGADPEHDSRPGVDVVVQGDRLTGRIDHASLRRVLAELRRQAGIQSEFIDPGDDDTVSQAFDALPLMEAIGRLLNGRSFLLYRDTAAAAGEGSAHALRLLILPRTIAAAHSGSEPAAASVDEITQAMVDPDESVRARAEQLFEQALANNFQAVAGTPRPRR